MNFITHVSQSTVFALAAATLAAALRRRHANACYAVWMAASLKFLVPFAWIASIGASISWHSAPLELREVVSTADEFTSASLPATAATSTGSWIAPTLLAIWGAGCLFATARQVVRFGRVAAIVRAARTITVGRVRLAISRNALEPGVFGIFRPVLLFPDGIDAILTDRQLEAILAHELCHVRRRDNLAAAIHMAVEAIFWFHPLVWWLGARLVDARESACDEAVLRMGIESRVYAESILCACRYSIQTPAACYAGVTGGELQQRIERIVRHEFGARLSVFGRTTLSACAALAIALPAIVGMARTPVAQAQQPAGSETFEVVSIKPAAPNMRGYGFITDPGRMRMMNVTLTQIILEAYGVQSFQLVAKDPPQQRYEILASAPTHPSRVLDRRYQTMMQAMLAGRFHLQLHRDQKVMPVYALGIAKDGPKMKESSEPGLSTKSTQGHVTATGASMLDMASYLSRRFGKPVVDVTGLTKLYDFKLDWTPDAGEMSMEPPDPDKPRNDEPNGTPSLFTALQEQLGLKLESKRLPVEMLVIDHWEKPAEN
jgi:uncharacterized protein (TIGR03435 family)